MLWLVENVRVEVALIAFLVVVLDFSMCVHPWLVKAKDEPFLNGSRSLVIPCGRCPECLKARQNQWVTRFKLENQFWRNQNGKFTTYFITFTYSDDNLPDTRARALLDWQSTLKQLQRKLSQRVRFYLVSENGSTSGRLHFHCLLFGVPITDVQTFRTQILEKSWTKGFSMARIATGKDLWYVSKYVTKDVDAFSSSNWRTIETYSKRPCIGYPALSPSFQKYFTDNCRSDFVDSGFHYSLTRYMTRKVLSESQRKILLNNYEHEKMPTPYDRSNEEQKERASKCWREYFHNCKEYKRKKQKNILSYERLSDICKD